MSFKYSVKPPHTRAQPVLNLLEQSVSDQQALAGARRKAERLRAERFLAACAAGEAGAVRGMLAAGCPPDTVDYDGRSGLELASARGHLVSGVFPVKPMCAVACKCPE